jgi:DNA-binding FrmR family transcriptional regulator
MIEDGRDCLDVMTQIVAMRSAANALGGELLEDVALRCLRHPEDFASPQQAIEQAVHVLVRGGR